MHLGSGDSAVSCLKPYENLPFSRSQPLLYTDRTYFIFLSTILLSQSCNSIVPLHGAPCTEQVCPIVSGNIFLFKKKSYSSHSIVTFCNFDWVYWLESGLSGGILKTNIGLNVSVWTCILLCGSHESDEIFWQNNVTRRCTVFTVHTGKVIKAQIIQSSHSFHRKYSC